jgi:hypothetical protein
MVAADEDENFTKPAWKKYSNSKLYYEIYLPKKFKNKKSSNPDYDLYMRKNPSTGVGVLRCDKPLSITTAKDLEDFVHDLYIELYLYSDDDYYSDWEETAKVNRVGQHGYQFVLHEWSGYDQYNYVYDCFIDPGGYFYCVLSMADLEKSPDVGAGVTIAMDNDTYKSLKKPLSASERTADSSIQEVA